MVSPFVAFVMTQKEKAEHRRAAEREVQDRLGLIVNVRDLSDAEVYGLRDALRVNRPKP